MADPVDDNLDLTTVLPEVVSRITGLSVPIDNWSVETLTGGASEAGVYRIHGVFNVVDETRPWSVIVKVTGAADARLIDADRQREVNAFRSGLLRELPTGVRAPHLYYLDDRPNGSTALWMEDVCETQPKWSLAEYARAARLLGRFNGAYLSAAWPLPVDEWLSRQWLRQWAEASRDAVAALPELRQYPLMRRFCPDDYQVAVTWTWHNRDRMHHRLAHLPETFCHMDAMRRNVFLPDGVDSRDLVAADWSFSGLGAIGEELPSLVIGSAYFFEIDPSDLADLEDIALNNYVGGLREAGWRGDHELARAGYILAGALRMSVGTLRVERMLFAADDMEPIIRAIFGHSGEEVAEHMLLVNQLTTVRLIDAAKKLI